MGSTSYLSVNDFQTIFYELNQEYFNLNKIGKVTREGRWNYFVNGLLHQSEPRLLVLVNKVNQTFARLEQKGVKIFDSTIDDEEYVAKAQRYRESRHIYFDVATAIGNRIEELQNVCPELKKAYHELQCREVGLRYSLGAANGGLDALHQPDPAWLDKITELAKAWKQKQEFALSDELDELQMEQLEEMAKYPEWLEAVVKDPEYLSEVLSWGAHTFNPVEVIVKNYETRRKIKVALLAANLGYVRNLYLTKPEDEVLAYRTVPTKVDNVAKRILTLSIYHGSFKEFEPDQQERVNILKPTETIHFKQGNYNLTVEEFFKELGQKKKREGNIILFGDRGFVNFHPVKGVWNVDEQVHEMPPMTENDWTDYAPASRIASHAELVAQYGEEVNERDFFFKIMSTRQHPDLTALDCHAFWQIFIRMEDGNWKIISVGPYAHRFQQGICDGLWLFCATLRGVVCLLDQNSYYAHRQRGAYPIFPTEGVKKELLARIFYLMHGSGVFQFTGHNCAHRIQQVTDALIEDLPNFFKMSLTMGRTGLGPLDSLLAWAHGQWEWVRWLVLTVLHTCFLSHRSLRAENERGEEVDYSVCEYFNKNGFEFYNPSYLLYQIDQAHKTGEGSFVDGELYWSHTDEKMYQKKAIIEELSEDEDDQAGI